MLKTPVAFLIFNRPDTTQRVFEAIRQAKPTQLFVAADGPRGDRIGEADKCAQARRIIEMVDWDCEVVTLFREKNLGCRRAVSSAIDWFFENVEEGIILEDDCLPSQSFFGFCEELLEHYRSDTRIMQLCGTNLFGEWKRNDCSYFYSHYGPVWGWASWRRAWKYYDVDMKLWPMVKSGKFYEDFCLTTEEAKFRLNLYDEVFSCKIDTWDYQWGFAKMINSGLSIIPAKNMISNIGFRDDATHTLKHSSTANLPIHKTAGPLKHPTAVVRDKLYDVQFSSTYLPNEKNLASEIFNRLKSYF